jgi:hypothetical protein
MRRSGGAGDRLGHQPDRRPRRLLAELVRAALLRRAETLLD